MPISQRDSEKGCNGTPSPALPSTTKSTSQSSLARVAEVASHAFLQNESWRILHAEGPPETALAKTGVADSERQSKYQKFILGQFTPSLERGAFVVEASDFGVVAVWAPPGTAKPVRTAEEWNEVKREGRVLGATRGRLTDEARVEFVTSRYGSDYYALALLASDPRREKVRGGVRAVLTAVIEKARFESRVIWLLTNTEHAKAVYEHFGWQTVREICVGGCMEWAMILYPDRSTCAV
jgi:hypothetical protein